MKKIALNWILKILSDQEMMNVTGGCGCPNGTICSGPYSNEIAYCTSDKACVRAYGLSYTCECY